MPAADLSIPCLRFRTAFPVPVWRLWPAPGVLALELRDVTARTVSFVVLAADDGRELLRYHDPAAPWWLTLAGITPEGKLELNELDPNQFGQSVGRRLFAVPGIELTSASSPAPEWRLPEYHAATGPYFVPLAQFIGALTGTQPAAQPIDSIGLLETAAGTLLGCTLVESGEADGAGARSYELLLVSPAGTLTLRVPLGGAPGGPDDPRFCTFGPILYACGAPGEVLAWALPAVRPLL